MWDYYKDKTLRNLCLMHEFDFSKVSAFFAKNYSKSFFTPQECKSRYYELYNQEKTSGESFAEQSPLNKLLKQISSSQGEITERPVDELSTPAEAILDGEATEYAKDKADKERKFLEDLSRQKQATATSDSLLLYANQLLRGYDDRDAADKEGRFLF